MSTPMSHHPLVQLGSRRLTWLIVAGLAVAGVILALALTLPWSNSPYTAKAVPAPAAAPQAIPNAFEHGKPSLNPQAQRTPKPYVLRGPHDLGITAQAG